MAGFADRFAAEGNYATAISVARGVLVEYEERAIRDPAAYRPLVDRTRTRIEQLTARAVAEGADTEPRPSAFTLALVASASPEPTPEDEAVIARAKAEAERSGMTAYVNETLAGMAALRDADPVPGGDPRAQALTAGFERTIGRESRRRRVDATVYEAAVTAQVVPTRPERNLARRFARQSALLRRLGRERDAVTAAGEAVARYRERTDLDEDEKGYYAYSLVQVGEYRLGRGDVASARHGSFSGPIGEPGSMPAGWGLPIVLSPHEWRRLRRRLVGLARRLRR
jgi:hypothetical protein